MPLTPPTAIVAVSDADFDREVLASPVPTLVDLGAADSQTIMAELEPHLPH